MNSAIDKLAPAKQQSTNDPRPDLFPQGHLLPFILVTALFLSGECRTTGVDFEFQKSIICHKSSLQLPILEAEQICPSNGIDHDEKATSWKDLSRLDILETKGYSLGSFPIALAFGPRTNSPLWPRLSRREVQRSRLSQQIHCSTAKQTGLQTR